MAVKPRLRAGQNRITFEVPGLYNEPIMDVSEGDNFIVPRVHDRVQVSGPHGVRTWLVDTVTHTFVDELKNQSPALRQRIRIVLREP